MPIQGILEKDEEGDRVVMVLKEHPKTMTDKELRRYERNSVLPITIQTHQKKRLDNDTLM